MMMIAMMAMSATKVTNMQNCSHLDLEDCAEDEGEFGRDLENIPPRGDGEEGRDLEI